MAADITRTKTHVGVIFPRTADIFAGRLLAAAEAGEVLYLGPAGTYGLADANDAGKQQARGMALQDGAIGDVIDILRCGIVEGFDLSGLGYDEIIYLSDTPGESSEGAGTLTVVLGLVVPLTDGAVTKAYRFCPRYSSYWA